MKRLILNYAVMVAVIVVTLEFAAYAAGLFLESKNFMIGSLSSEGYDRYLMERDTITGWPSPSVFGSGEFDTSGARISESFSDPSQKSCVALFGDSFTWGDEVPPSAAYGDVLAGLLGCRVANYGVGGFGTDQAFLRYSRRVNDPAPIVILGHYSENIIRNVNQLRDLMAGTRFGFKPRFTVSDSGDLESIPLPTLTGAEYQQLPMEAYRLLPYEFFLPDTSRGLAVRSFPNMLSVPKVLFNYRIAARIAGKPSYAAFYQPDHSSNALAVTVGILRAFNDLALKRGQTPIVMLIPDAKDLESGRETGHFPFEPLSDTLSEYGITTIPLATELLSKISEKQPCQIYTSCNPSGGHFNADGYALVAQIVDEWLREQGIEPSDQ